MSSHPNEGIFQFYSNGEYWATTSNLRKGAQNAVQRLLWVSVRYSVMSDFAIPWTVAHQASLSMEFPRQKYWSGLPVPFSREYSQPKNQTQVSCTEGRFFSIWATREAPGSPWKPFRGSISSKLFHNNTKILFCYPFIFSWM